MFIRNAVNLKFIGESMDPEVMYDFIADKMSGFRPTSLAGIRSVLLWRIFNLLQHWNDDKKASGKCVDKMKIYSPLKKFGDRKVRGQS